MEGGKRGEKTRSKLVRGEGNHGHYEFGEGGLENTLDSHENQITSGGAADKFDGSVESLCRPRNAAHCQHIERRVERVLPRPRLLKRLTDKQRESKTRL